MSPPFPNKSDLLSTSSAQFSEWTPKFATFLNYFGPTLASLDVALYAGMSVQRSQGLEKQMKAFWTTATTY